MKKISLLILSTIVAIGMNAEKMRIWKNNQIVYQQSTTQIDSITFAGDDAPDIVYKTTTVKGRVAYEAGWIDVSSGTMTDLPVPAANIRVILSYTDPLSQSTREFETTTNPVGEYEMVVPMLVNSINSAKISVAAFEAHYTYLSKDKRWTTISRMYAVDIPYQVDLTADNITVLNMLLNGEGGLVEYDGPISSDSRTKQLPVKGSVKLAAEQFVYGTGEEKKKIINRLCADEGSVPYTNDINGGAFKLVITREFDNHNFDCHFIYDVKTDEDGNFSTLLNVFNDWDYSDVEVYASTFDFTYNEFTHYYYTPEYIDGDSWVLNYGTWQEWYDKDDYKNLYRSQKCTVTYSGSSDAKKYDGFNPVVIDFKIGVVMSEDSKAALRGVGNAALDYKIEEEVKHHIAAGGCNYY